MRTHEIKLDLSFCNDVMNGKKQFDIRKNDRGYQKGDMLKFMPVRNGSQVKHEIQLYLFEITHVLSGWGLKNGYVALGIEKHGNLIEKSEQLNK